MARAFRAEGKPSSRSSPAAASATGQPTPHGRAPAMRGGADVIYQGVFADDDWRGISDFLVRVERPSRWAPGATRPGTPSSRGTPSRTSSCSSASTPSSSNAFKGRVPKAMVRRPRHRREERLRYRDFDAYYRPSAGASSRLRVREPADLSLSRRALRLCESQRRLRAPMGRRRSSEPRRRHPPRAGAAAERGRHPHRRAARGDRRRRSASASAPSRSSGCGIRQRCRPSIAAPARIATSCCPSTSAPVSACCPAPSPGDIFFDMEGDPVLRAERRARVPVRRRDDRRGRAEFRAFQALDRDEEKVGVRAVHRLRAARLSSGPTCTSITTRRTSRRR